MGLIDDEDFAPDSGSLTLSTEEFPELEGIKVGDEIKGNYVARVKSVEDGMVTLLIESQEIETENFADRELRNMKSNMIEVSGDDEEEDEDD